MDKTLKITNTYHYSPADVLAMVMDNGWVKIWFNYKDIQQDRHAIICTAEEWDRLVAWVEWQRKNKDVNRGDS
jgi:hypothetical protein